MYAKLLLASTSESRKELLSEARIPFEVIGQVADEYSCSWNVPINDLVRDIARLKMTCAVMPASIPDDAVCVVTADTLVADFSGKIYGKPEGRIEAIEMIRSLRDRDILVVTGMCVERRRRCGEAWVVEARRDVVSVNKATFSITDEWIPWYIDNTVSIFVAGSVAIDQVGLRFVRYVEGSIAAIRGLPVYELQQALIELGFFEVPGV